MVCPRCGRDNPESNQFCGRCGFEMAQYQPPTTSSDDVQYCYKHKHEPTQLTCGRCGKPVCHRCVVIGPAGPRCRECAKQNIPISGRGIWYDITSRLRGLTAGGPFAWYWYFIIISMVLGGVRGCSALLRPRVEPGYDYRQVAPDRSTTKPNADSSEH